MIYNESKGIFPVKSSIKNITVCKCVLGSPFLSINEIPGVLAKIIFPFFFQLIKKRTHIMPAVMLERCASWIVGKEIAVDCKEIAVDCMRPKKTINQQEKFFVGRVPRHMHKGTY